MFGFVIPAWVLFDDEKRAVMLAEGLIVIAAYFLLPASRYFADEEERGLTPIAALIGIVVGVALGAGMGEAWWIYRS
jgi:hypothetical protein